MSVIWSGITEGGAVVPVQVTEEGKVVAVGDGPQGDYLPITGGELTGDLEVDGSGKFKGYVLSGLNPGSSNNNNSGSMISEDGRLVLFHASTSTVGSYLRCHKHDGAGSYDDLTTIKSDGSIWIGGNHISANPSPNITLNADGKAIFADNVSTLNGVFSTARITGQSKAFVGKTGSKEGIQILADGTTSIGGDLTPTTPGGVTPTSPNITLNADGSATFAGEINASGKIGSTRATAGQVCFTGASVAGGQITSKITADGSCEFAGGKCGFTADGELIFSSRGTRYKLFVSQGVCQAEEYTRQMELKEKAERFVAGQRETKPSQPGVTPDNDNA
jgi:hypothetical protein